MSEKENKSAPYRRVFTDAQRDEMDALEPLDGCFSGSSELTNQDHTPEPWRLLNHEWRNMLIYGDDPRVKEGRFIAEVNLYFSGAEANARRIVAAVNACAGVPTAELEEVGGHFGGVYADAKKRIAERTEQRDRLLEALRAITEQDQHGRYFISVREDIDVTAIIGPAIANAEST
jgi:hypothetical protein